MQLRRDSKLTKIVATIGPASCQPETLRAMIRGGMNVARINFSHGDHQAHGETIDNIRRLAAEEDAVVAVLCDIQGPKIRIGDLQQEQMMLEIGDSITLTLDDLIGEHGLVSLPHPEFLRDIEAGATLLLDDGNLQFNVLESDGRNLVCNVVVGGALKSRKGVSAPNARLTLSAITDKDTAKISNSPWRRIAIIWRCPSCARRMTSVSFKALMHKLGQAVRGNRQDRNGRGAGKH